ncbi:hypothetical protein NLJ89_g7533 [Agrocybe chaxingu]|uniref:F-box domain-containing protein n=1 Tax=Agrocybe chaxingu TaxID=84603 RepID=A0A9W8K495_9AGAR|nr:hypothetical protein NLJ89_g7533 [Agrocybe chaxingu]
MKKLYEKRYLIKTLRNKFHDKLAAALPVELLSRIFVFCIEDHSVPIKRHTALNLHDPPYRRRTRPTGFILGAVCKRWQEIARSTPQLWTTVSVKIKEGDIDFCAQFTRDWLSRTGNLPLTLDIYQPEDTQTIFGPPPAFDASPIFDKINAHSSQWATISANVHSNLMRLLHGDENGAPRLHTLDIATINHHPFHQHLIPPIVFALSGPTPGPTRVTLHHIRFPSAIVVWEAITYLDIQEAPIAECYAILQRATRLIECYIQEIELPGLESVSPPHPFLLPQLKVLHILWNDAKEILLNALTLPSLTSLHSDGPLSTLPSLITRSACKSTLTKLGVSDMEASMADLMRALESVPMLTQLAISGIKLDDTLFDRLASTAFFDPAQVHANADNMFLPHLTSLTLVSDPALFSFEAIAPIFISKHEHEQERRKRRPLSRFWLEVRDPNDGNMPLQWHIIDPVHPVEVDLLRTIKDGGVDLQIYDGKGVDLFMYDADESDG